MRRFSILATLAAVDLALAFLTQSYVLLTIGVGSATDAYFAGQVLPVVLLAIIQMPLQRASVSAFSGSDPKEGYPALRLVVAVAGILGAFTALLSLVAPFAIDLLYPALPGAARDTAVNVLRIQSISVVIAASNLVLLSLNQLESRFYRCEVSLLASGALSAVFVVFSVHHLGVLAAAYGQLLKASLCALLYLLPLKGQLTWGVPPWKEIGRIVAPLSSAGMLTKLAPLVDRSLAATAASGSVTVLSYSQTFYNATVGIVERSLIAPRLPALKNQAPRSSLRFAGKLALAGFAVAATVSLALMTLLLFPKLAPTIAHVKLMMLLQCIVLLAGYPAAAASSQWMAGVLTMSGRAAVTARIVAWGFLASVGLKVIGFQLGGLNGLAIAISVYYALSAGALALVLRKLERSARIDGPRDGG